MTDFASSGLEPSTLGQCRGFGMGSAKPSAWAQLPELAPLFLRVREPTVERRRR